MGAITVKGPCGKSLSPNWLERDKSGKKANNRAVEEKGERVRSPAQEKAGGKNFPGWEEVIWTKKSKKMNRSSTSGTQL